jgi:hypothetical protein
MLQLQPEVLGMMVLDCWKETAAQGYCIKRCRT